MEKKNQSGNRRPSVKRQAAKSLSGHIRARNRPAVRKMSRSISKGDHHTQRTSSDQQLIQVVQQGLKDDQALSAVAGDIRVTVKDGAITLAGDVSTEQQMNLAANTAMAVGVVEEVNNRMEITHKPFSNCVG